MLESYMLETMLSQCILFFIYRYMNNLKEKKKEVAITPGEIPKKVGLNKSDNIVNRNYLDINK